MGKPIETAITRKSFIAGMAASAAALAAGCSADSSLTETNAVASNESSSDIEFSDTTKGEWKPVQCWTSCGGKCLLQAYIVDGVVTRVKTDDVYEESIETFQNRGCCRGRSQRFAHSAAERLKYPMKRKHWMPGGGDNVNGQLRGEDEWERITWDEAFDYVSQEMRRIYDEHGPSSVLHMSFPRTILRSSLLNPLGGCSTFEFCDSYGASFMYSGNLGSAFYGFEPGHTANNDRLDLLNADYIVFEGGNPAWCSAGSPMYHFWRAKQAGAKFVYVGPEKNLTAMTLDAKWIPCRPGADTAFLLGVAYEMLRLDEQHGNVIDWDFLNRCTIGFDDEHMPEGASSSKNVKGYIEGLYDGMPKTAEWASEICGASAEDIKWFAGIMGKNNAVSLLMGYAPQRCNGAENLLQMLETVGCMGGHHGKPGHSCGLQYHFFSGNDGPEIVKVGDPYPEGKAPDLPASTVDDMINHTYVWQAVNTGEYDWYNTVVGTDGKSLIKPVEHRKIDIRMIVNDFGNPLTVRCNTNEGIKAFRKVDFVLDIGLAFNATAQYSDIVLPVATSWEDANGDDYHLNQQNRETLMWQQFGVKAPYYECKTDREITIELARRLGLDVDALFPYTGAEMHMNRLLNATVVKPDGSTPLHPTTVTSLGETIPGDDVLYMMPLVKITKEDIEKYHIRDFEPREEGLTTIDEMVEKGIYHVARTPGDKFGYIAYQEFCEDSEAHPLGSASGKMELFCQDKADIFVKLGWQDPADPIPPYASYVKPRYGYEESFENWETKKKGKYPIQIFNGHYLRRSHSAFDSNGYLREAFASPMFISKTDADERGIKTGDWIRAFNDTGSIVRQASVVESMMPGVANTMHGSWLELDENGNSINGGTNVLIDSTTSAGVQQGYNTRLVQIEKYERQDILPDVERPVVLPRGVE